MRNVPFSASLKSAVVTNQDACLLGGNLPAGKVSSYAGGRFAFLFRRGDLFGCTPASRFPRFIKGSVKAPIDHRARLSLRENGFSRRFQRSQRFSCEPVLSRTDSSVRSA
ncbi:hypothetical protein, partial [Allomesorhizobium alhagi]|uniref:hypothetical protein n=1 Tax=Allomesorhizobium alhagi TaxID=475067 RepID=UPI001AEC685F